MIWFSVDIKQDLIMCIAYIDKYIIWKILKNDRKNWEEAVKMLSAVVFGKGFCEFLLVYIFILSIFFIKDLLF